MQTGKFIFLSASIFFVIPFVGYTQISHGGQPMSRSYDQIQPLNQLVELPGKNAIPQYLMGQDNSKVGAYQFAWAFDVDLSIDNAGQWDTTSQGDKIWRLGIFSEGAYSLNFIFDEFVLPDGAELFIYNSDYSVVLGAFTSANNNSTHSLAIAPVSGNFVVIEYIEPLEAIFNGLLHISKVGHDFTNAFGNKDGNYGRAGACNVDINCADGNNWQDEKRAVCRIVYNTTGLCTGTLVNNTRRNRKPFVLTANHCIDAQSDATNSVFIFNYESPTCGGIDGSVSQSVSGSELLATKNAGNGFLDFSLLLLNDVVPEEYKPYFAGWDASGATPSKTVCIHHPKGDVKKISIDIDPPAANITYGFGYDPFSFFKILEWNTGTTEKGSSGAPLFDQNHRLVGTLTGGDALCDSSVNDYFQMFAVDYNKYNADTLQLQHWLDPDNKGITYLDGYKPFAAYEYANQLINVYHWSSQDSGAVYQVNKEGEFGYVSGNNSYGDKAKAEFFNKSEFGTRDVITGAYVWFARAKGRPYQDVEFFLKPDDGFGSPSKNQTIATSYLGMDEIIRNAEDSVITYFPFDPPAEISTHIYAGITLPQYAGDTLAIVNTNIDPAVNTAWELGADNEWYPYELTWGYMGENEPSKKFGLLIALVAGKYLSVDNDATPPNYLSLFPNPANNEVTISINRQGSRMESVYIYNLMGQIKYADPYINKTDLILDVHHWENGIYFIRVVSDGVIQNTSMVVAN